MLLLTSWVAGWTDKCELCKYFTSKLTKHKVFEAMPIVVFLFVTLYSLVSGYHRIGGKCHLYLQHLYSRLSTNILKCWGESNNEALWNVQGICRTTWLPISISSCSRNASIICREKAVSRLDYSAHYNSYSFSKVMGSFRAHRPTEI
jgi:hypothetical protein